MHSVVNVIVPPSLEKSYSVVINNNILYNWRYWLMRCYQGNKVVIISDDTVANLYAKRLHNLLIPHYQTLLLCCKPGEQAKSATVKSRLEEKIFQTKNYDRSTFIIAIGGGVVGDLAGFIAATYMRGVNYVQIPTTLLAMVDSSVGGKVAINTPYGKNMIGTFYQPKAVIIDTECLNTLNQELFIDGLIEAIKMFLTSDVGSFNYLRANLALVLKRTSNNVIHEIIVRAVRIKSAIVTQDEQEQGLRKVLNLGHTVGHALEKVTNYAWTHGKAVALGIIVEANIAYRLGKLKQNAYQTIIELFNLLGFNYTMLSTLNKQALLNAMLADKKNHNNAIHMVLLKGIGEVDVVIHRSENGYIDGNYFTQEISKECILAALSNDIDYIDSQDNIMNNNE